MKFDSKSVDLFVSKPVLLLEDGDYIAKVTAAEDQISQAGNEMIKITLEIIHENMKFIILDYLVDKVLFKMKVFCKAANLVDKFDNDELHAIDCLYKQVGVTVGAQAGKLKYPNDPENTDKYKDKNIIKKYYPVKITELSIFEDNTNNKESLFNNDDIPF